MEECIDCYGRLVRGIAGRVFTHQADADDAVQEAFAAIWMNAVRYDASRGPEHGFVAMIARQRVIDHLRRVKRNLLHAAGSLEVHQPELTWRDEESGYDMAPVQAAFDRLKPAQQRVIRLALQHGLTREQIGRYTECSPNTVKSHMRRGLERLRDYLGATAGAP
jgi:RNA polymerase sigma-70 factor (ECF subfamily)